MQNRKFHTRGFTSLLVALSFLFMTISGIVLYFAPHGRVAYWTFWEFLGLDRIDWINVHVLTSLLFIGAAAYHLYLNWGVITGYVVSKVTHALNQKKELAIALAVTLLFTMGSLYPFPPFSSIIDFGEYLKNAWVTSREYEPPFGHAERVSLKVLAKRMNIDLPPAIEEMKKNGIRIENPSDSLERIAKMNNTTPMQIYTYMKKFEKREARAPGVAYTPELVEEKFAGTGIGRKTIGEISEENGLAPEQVTQRLSASGIKAQESETLREIAARYDTVPIEILKGVLIEGYTLQKGGSRK